MEKTANKATRIIFFPRSSVLHERSQVRRFSQLCIVLPAIYRAASHWIVIFKYARHLPMVRKLQRRSPAPHQPCDPLGMRAGDHVGGDRGTVDDSADPA